MTKQQILEYTGLSEKDFYAKYKNPEDFFNSKKGKEFKLAQNGLSTIGTVKNQYVKKNIPEDELIEGNFMNNYEATLAQMMAGQQQYTPSKGLTALGNLAQSPLSKMLGQKKTNQIKTRGLVQPVNQLPTAPILSQMPIAQNGLTSFNFDKSAIGNIGGAFNLAGDIVQGIQGIQQGKHDLANIKQAYAVSDIARQAASTREELPGRQYVRPEDIVTQGEELFPVYGVGTNPLAQNGTQLYSDTDQDATYYPNAYGEIQNTYAPEYDLYEDLEDFPIAQQGTNIYDNVNQTMNNVLGPLYGQKTGKTLGGTLGGAVGSFFGPAGNLIGTQVGNLAQWAFDSNPRKINKYKRKLSNNAGAMAGMGVGAQVQQQYNNIAQNGASLPEGNLLSDNLEVLWGGDAEPVSYNPYLPQGGETIKFDGNLHNGNPIPGKSGIGITYNGNNVEVEKGEVATILKGKDGREETVVFGNVEIPKGVIDDPEAAGKKYKNYASLLSKKENIANKNIKKNLKAISSITPLTPYDKLQVASHEANILGNKLKLKIYANNKQVAANSQEGFNNVAEAFGLDVNALVKGKLKMDDGKFTPSNRISKNGTTLQDYDVAEFGVNIPKVDLSQFLQAKQAYDVALKTGDREAVERFQSLYNPKFDTLDSQKSKKEKKSKAAGESTSSKDKEKSKLEQVLTGINSIVPHFRPSDASNFNYNQILGELAVLGNNNVEPVFAQSYRPQLAAPYDVSYQDLVNNTTSQIRSAQKMAGYNPVVQALIAGTGYEANNKILGEQFRANQAKRDQVIGNNINSMNDANIRNLAIFDQQANRQSLARSNTKAAKQTALDSMYSKQLQHALENQKLAIMENLYNYRFPDGRATNMNPLAMFNTDAQTILNLLKEQASKKSSSKSKKGEEEEEEGVAQNGKSIYSSEKSIPIARAFKLR